MSFYSNIYKSSAQNCQNAENTAIHINNIYADGELTKISTSKDFLLVRQEGNRQVQRNIAHYNLDMIIALGYRVQFLRTFWGGVRKCPQEVRGMEVMRLLGDKVNPYNRMKKNWLCGFVVWMEKKKQRNSI